MLCDFASQKLMSGQAAPFLPSKDSVAKVEALLAKAFRSQICLHFVKLFGTFTLKFP
jgi:hypothetical protein